MIGDLLVSFSWYTWNNKKIRIWKRWWENIAKDRKVIPDPIDDRKFQEWKEKREDKGRER